MSREVNLKFYNLGMRDKYTMYLYKFQQYLGETQIRGITVDHWQSCLYWPNTRANFTLDYYFTGKRLHIHICTVENGYSEFMNTRITTSLVVYK